MRDTHENELETMITQKSQENIINFSGEASEAIRVKKPIWVQYREALQKGLSDLKRDLIKNDKNASRTMIEAFKSLESIFSETLNPSLLRILTLKYLAFIQLQHPIWSRLYWRLEYQLIWALRNVIDRPEYNESALYYAYNAMIENLLREKLQEIKHLESELQAVTTGSRSEEITREYHTLLEDRKILNVHVRNLSEELDALKDENSKNQNEITESKSFSQEAKIIIQNLQAQILEYQRSTNAIENELDRALNENEKLVDALKALNEKNMELQSQCDSLNKTVSSQKKIIETLTLEKSQIQALAKKGVYDSSEYHQLEKEKSTLVKQNQSQSEVIKNLTGEVKNLKHIRQQNIQQIEHLQSLLGAAGLVKNFGLSKLIQSKLSGILDKLNSGKEDEQEDASKSLRLN